MTPNTVPSLDVLRPAIAAHCRTGSWFALRPLLLRMPTLPEAGPELLADLLASAGARARTEAERLQRLLSQRFWHLSPGLANGGRQAITVHCGAANWTIQLRLQPQLHIETIGR